MNHQTPGHTRPRTMIAFLPRCAGSLFADHIPRTQHCKGEQGNNFSGELPAAAHAEVAVVADPWIAVVAIRRTQVDSVEDEAAATTDTT